MTHSSSIRYLFSPLLVFLYSCLPVFLSSCLLVFLSSCLLVFLFPCKTVAQAYLNTRDFAFSQHNFVDSIPIEIEDGKIYLRIQLMTPDQKGQGRVCRFNLDTGAGMGTLYADTPIRPVRFLGHGKMVDATGRHDTVSVVAMPDFRLGNTEVKHYPVHYIRRPDAHANVDGLIGFDLFARGLAAKIDVRNRVLIITDRKKYFRNENGYELKYTLQSSVPHIQLTFPFSLPKGKQGRLSTDDAVFDTGSRSLYAMNLQRYHRILSQDSLFATQVQATTTGSTRIGSLATEQNAEVAILRLQHLCWGQFSFDDVHANTTNGLSCLGADVLRFGNVIINPFRRTLTFQPFQPLQTSVVVNNQLPSIYYVEDPLHRPVVGLVLPGSEEERQGFTPGDVILSINNKTTPTFTAFRQYPFAKGQTYTFFLRSASGQTKTIRKRMQ